MSNLWLIVEGENDYDVVRHILKQRGISATVRRLDPTGNSGGISRLAAQLERLIATARQHRLYNNATDCIAVLHDQDMGESYQIHHDRIRTICKREHIKQAVARDELESWLLADSGLCTWLGIEPGNWDEQPRPSAVLASRLKDKGQRYQGLHRTRINEHLSGDGDAHSPSMRAALQLLSDAPCTRTP